MEKMTFRQRLENFWYHNKFAIIVVPIFVIFIVVSLVQIFTKDEPDANFLYMGPSAIAFSGENLLQESISLVMREDYNDDGKKYVDYIELTALSPDDKFDDTDGDFATGYTSAQVQKTVGETFAAQIVAGDSMIYLLDEAYFNVAKSTNALMPLSEALGYTPDFAVNEYAVRICDLDIYYLPGFELLPKNTLVCIRYPVTLTNGKKEVELREKCNLSVFKDMFAYVYPDKPEEVVLPDPVPLGIEDFKILLTQFSNSKALNISEDVISESTDITPDGFFEETGANLFKCQNAVYLAYYEKLYALGKHIGGEGLTDIKTCDFDDDGKYDIIFTYSYMTDGQVVSSASVFSFNSMKETFLSIEYPSPLYIEKLTNSKFDIFAKISDDETKHVYTINSSKDGYEIIFRGM